MFLITQYLATEAFHAICAASSTVTIDFKLADIKLESSEAYLPKLEKNLSYGFEILDIFCKNAVLNICRYLKRFHTYKKINNIFLKFDHPLLKSWKSVKSFLPKNQIQKQNQRAHKVQATLNCNYQCISLFKIIIFIIVIIVTIIYR